MLKIKVSPMMRRLMPLYVATFLQNIPFWYAVEKIFMLDIGFNTATIGLMVAVMSIVMLAVETPSGILADRWSRKGVMVLGCLALLTASVLGALSFNQTIYIVSTVFWGIYAALYSGVYDAVIYDTAVEEYGDSGRFEKYLGRFRAVEGIACVMGALLGGLIASTFVIRDTYIFSIPFIALALIFIWRVREPQLHKAEVTDPVFKHIRQTFAAVLRNPVLLPVVVAAVGFLVLEQMLFELSQLWFIAVVAPIALYGIFSAVVFSSWTLGGLLSVRVKSKPTGITLMIVLIAMIITLALVRHYMLVLAAQFVLAICLVTVGIILAKKMHDEFPSRLRAGSSSVISTLARFILIPASLLITGIANSYNIFVATYTLLVIVIISVIAFMFVAFPTTREKIK